MRLSEQGLSTAEDVVRAGGRLTKDGILALIAEVRALRPVEKAAEDFVAKVDSGRARSVDSYGKFAAALAGVRALEDR